MVSLVDDYGNSSCDSYEESSNPPREPKLQDAGGCGLSTDYFNTAGHVSSDDSDAGCSGTVERPPVRSDAPTLPTPRLDSAQSRGSFLSPACTSSSVFVNPFDRAEEAKLGILQRHVHLTEAAPTRPASKQVCFKFRKGKCLRGDKCRFFHDRSNIPLKGIGAPSSSRSSVTAGGVTNCWQGVDPSDQFDRLGALSGHDKHQSCCTDVTSDVLQECCLLSRGVMASSDTIKDSDTRKKKHGVSDTLTPPKKALLLLEEIRKAERPWTYNEQHLQ